MTEAKKFYEELEDFFKEYPELNDLDINMIGHVWFAIGEMHDEKYLLAQNDDGISMKKLDESPDKDEKSTDEPDELLDKIEE